MVLQLSGSNSHLAVRRPGHRTVAQLLCINSCSGNTQQWSWDQLVVLDSLLGQEDIAGIRHIHVKNMKQWESMGESKMVNGTTSCPENGKNGVTLWWSWKQGSHLLIRCLSSQLMFC